MNDLDELVYAMEDLDLSKEELIKVFMNKGDTGGPQGKFEGETSSIKEKWQEPKKEEKNFSNKAKKNDDFIKNFHNSDKAKFMPNRLRIGDIGTQFLDLDCKRNSEDDLDLWSQNMLLYFLMGKGNYTDEEKYIIMINTFTGKVNDWFSGLTEDAVKIIKNDTLEGLKNSLQEGIGNLKLFVANEFFGGLGDIADNREKARTIAKEQLEKLQICKMSYIQEYTCEFEEYYYKIFDSGKEMLPYLEKYYQKLPGFWAKYFREEYEKENKKGDTLGQRISFLKNRLGQLCMSHNIQRKAKRINTQMKV